MAAQARLFVAFGEAIRTLFGEVPLPLFWIDLRLGYVDSSQYFRFP